MELDKMTPYLDGLLSLYKEGDKDPLDGDAVEELGELIKNALNFTEGNITLDEYYDNETDILMNKKEVK